MSVNKKVITINVGADMYNALKQDSDNNFRSMTGQVKAIIREHLLSIEIPKRTERKY